MIQDAPEPALSVQREEIPDPAEDFPISAGQFGHMRVSIEAGFQKGEIAATLGLDHRAQESVSWRGSIRIFAEKTEVIR